MTRLTKAPTVPQFVEAWSNRFEKAVRDAAGSNDRLSINEARKIAERDDALKLWGDNAVNYLEKTGQKSVSVNKLMSVARDYAEAAAKKVAGQDRGDSQPARISLAEARLLPKDLIDDFFELRGRREPDIQSTTDIATTDAAEPVKIVIKSYHPGLTGAVEGDVIKLAATDDVPHNAKIVVRYDNHMLTMRLSAKGDRMFNWFNLRERMAKGYGVEMDNIWGPHLTLKITRDASDSISEKQAIQVAAKAIETFWKAGRVEVNSWPNDEPITWDDILEWDDKLAEKLTHFGDPEAPGEIYEYGCPSAAGVRSTAEHWVVHGPGPMGYEMRVSVNKASGEADRVQIEFD